MSKFTDVNELPFTSEQLEYFETEMRKYKVPLITNGSLVLFINGGDFLCQFYS